MVRTTFLIDGFNLYHSVKEASRALNGATTKWLDIFALCTSCLNLIDKEASINEVYYFSALARHIESTDANVTKRHMDFIQCLKATGIIVELSRFKEKRVKCENCRNDIIRHEEKETDVAISVKLMEILFMNMCDVAVLVTGDTDLAPAVRTAHRLFQNKQVWFAFPYARKNKELTQLVSPQRTFRIKKERYLKCQFVDPFILPDGKRVPKPASW